MNPEGLIYRLTGGSDRPETDRWLALVSLLLVGAGLIMVLSSSQALAYLNYRQFGLFMPSAGYYLIRDQQQVLAFAPQVGALGLFFDRTFGLIGRAPLYLLAFLGLHALWRRYRAGHRDELLALGLGWLLSFLYIADIAYWWADGSPSSRYLVATVPLLAAAVAGGIETVALAARFRPVLTTAAIAAVAWSAYAVFSYAMEPTLGYDLATEVRATGTAGRFWLYVGKVLRPDPGSAFPSLLLIDGRSVALGVAWLAIAVALVAVGWRLAPREVREGVLGPTEAVA